MTAIRDALMFGLTGITLNSSKMYQEREKGRSIAQRFLLHSSDFPGNGCHKRLGL